MTLIYNEIHDTFETLKKTGDYINKRWRDIEMFFINKSRFIFIGCGSSYSNAKSYAMLCNMSAGVPAMALAAGDILLHAERYKKCINGAGVVIISRSGKTTELLKALDALRETGCRFTVASFICADDTPLGEKSDMVLSTPWAFDESVCQTRCVTNAYFMAVYITAKLTGDTSVLSDLNYLLDQGPSYMEKCETFAMEVAAEPWTHAVVLADAELEGVAEEGSLVFKEVCQMPSNYYHLLDVRHGPMVLIGKNTLVIAALGTSCELENGLVKDLVDKNAVTAVISDAPVIFECVRCINFDKPLSHSVKGIALIILCQLIAFYKSREIGVDPENPTGLTPWIAI